MDIRIIYQHMFFNSGKSSRDVVSWIKAYWKKHNVRHWLSFWNNWPKLRWLANCQWCSFPLLDNIEAFDLSGLWEIKRGAYYLKVSVWVLGLLGAAGVKVRYRLGTKVQCFMTFPRPTKLNKGLNVGLTEERKWEENAIKDGSHPLLS